MIGQGDALPRTDHIVRYVGKMNFRDDGTVDGAAFRKRANELRPSVNWLDFFDGTKEQQIAQVREVFHLKRGKLAKFAELRIGTLIAAAKKASKSVRLSVIYLPLPASGEYKADPSHAEIEGLPLDDKEKIICDLVAECVIAYYPAVLREGG